jgi:hypothetical protein
MYEVTLTHNPWLSPLAYVIIIIILSIIYFSIFLFHKSMKILQKKTHLTLQKKRAKFPMVFFFQSEYSP